MIEEILIRKHPATGKIEATVFPMDGTSKLRVYPDLTASSCKRLEAMMLKHNVRPYLRKRWLSIWIIR